MADIINDGLYDQAEATARKAKNGTLRYEGKVYTLTNSYPRWGYNITDELGRPAGPETLTAKTLKTAKADLLFWLTH